MSLNQTEKSSLAIATVAVLAGVQSVLNSVRVWFDSMTTANHAKSLELDEVKTREALYTRRMKLECDILEMKINKGGID